MAVNRVRVVWTGAPTSGGGLSTFYFNAAVGTPAQQVTTVATFLTGTNDRRVLTCAWATEADVATLNHVTGALEGITATTPATGTGTVAGDAMSPTTQGLLRLTTSSIVGGRLLRGRIFLPGAGEVDNGPAGMPSVTYTNDYDGSGSTLITDANTDFVVWSPTHGAMASVDSVSTWTKWAVLRSRRD